MDFDVFCIAVLTFILLIAVIVWVIKNLLSRKKKKIVQENTGNAKIRSKADRNREGAAKIEGSGYVDEFLKSEEKREKSKQTDKSCWRCRKCGRRSPMDASICTNPDCGSELSLWGDVVSE